jgi:hypothetical protein
VNAITDTVKQIENNATATVIEASQSVNDQLSKDYAQETSQNKFSKNINQSLEVIKRIAIS